VRGGPAQAVAVDLREAALESACRFTLDGVAPEAWDPIAGLYPCRDGFVRVHTNFAHHRDGLLALLGLPTGAGTPRARVAEAIAGRDAVALETEATARGLVVAALRDAAAWDAHPQAAAVAALPLVAIERVEERSGAAPSSPAFAAAPLAPGARPLDGLRVADLTRVLAGPVAGRTLAAHGADVLAVNAPHLPNIPAIADLSRGKRSALADLRDPSDRARFRALLAGAHVVVDGYRPGALAALGFGAEDVERIRPGIVHASLSAYGGVGPWGGKRGFDSLVQTATGLNVAEGAAFAPSAAGAPAAPHALPVQILDMATGFLLAFGVAAALLRQRDEGGGWRVRVSLARTALWLRTLPRLAVDPGAPPFAFDDGSLETSQSGFGVLRASPHAGRLAATPARYARPSVPPGSHPLGWA
jgi:crotonobetainyl-CoA:carnitine CoA-transferase CaiB-like acyl-CoA transferase